MAFSGSPEPLDKTESGRHGMMVGEINEVTRMVTSLKFIPLAKLQVRLPGRPCDHSHHQYGAGHEDHQEIQNGARKYLPVPHAGDEGPDISLI